jgi:protoporphyrinogen oxidase
VRLEEEVEAVDAERRRVRLASGDTLGYEALISTLPLDRLLAITSGLPGDLPAAGQRLRAVRVLNLSLGIDRPRISGAHWVYFPEREFSFYRIGFPGNMSPHVVPRGCSSIYVERSLRRDETFDTEEVAATAIDDLRRAGVLWRGDRVVYRQVSVLDPAYVIHDGWRARNLPRILEVLREVGIHSAGRFGAWEYSSMEEALRAGIDLAARIAPAFAGRYQRARAASS